MVHPGEYFRRKRLERQQNPHKTVKTVWMSGVLSIAYVLFVATLMIHARSQQERCWQIASLAVVSVLWLRYIYERLTS